MKKILSVLFFLVLSAHLAFAEDPTSLQKQAKTNIETANRLYVKAGDMVKSDASVENLRSAVSLLIEAGKLFEEAGDIYKSLMPEYATEQDAQNSYVAMQECVKAVQGVQSQIDLKSPKR